MPAAKSPAAASGGPRRRLTGLVEQLSCAVTWLRLPRERQPARDYLIGRHLGGALFRRDQPRLGRRLDEARRDKPQAGRAGRSRGQVEDTYGSFNLVGNVLVSEYGPAFTCSC